MILMNFSSSSFCVFFYLVFYNITFFRINTTNTYPVFNIFF